MAEDDWAIRAQATTQREEIELLRGAVSALRKARARDVVHAPPARSGRIGFSLLIAVAFSMGVLVTLTAIAVFRICG